MTGYFVSSGAWFIVGVILGFFLKDVLERLTHPEITVHVHEEKEINEEDD